MTTEPTKEDIETASRILRRDTSWFPQGFKDREKGIDWNRLFDLVVQALVDQREKDAKIADNQEALSTGIVLLSERKGAIEACINIASAIRRGE